MLLNALNCALKMSETPNAAHRRGLVPALNRGCAKPVDFILKDTAQNHAVAVLVRGTELIPAGVAQYQPGSLWSGYYFTT